MDNLNKIFVTELSETLQIDFKIIRTSVLKNK